MGPSTFKISPAERGYVREKGILIQFPDGSRE